jgi:hypothetical protein
MKEFRESFNRRVGETIEKMRGKEWLVLIVVQL